jgi:hypothetical protein
MSPISRPDPLNNPETVSIIPLAISTRYPEPMAVIIDWAV